MGCSLTEPEHLTPIFDKPGRDWPAGERGEVMGWLMAGPQLRRLLLFATHHLGYGATAQDAEDAWQSYILYYSNRNHDWIYAWDGDVDRYDPGKGLRFLDFMCYNFRRFCWRIGARLRKQTRIVKSIEVGEDEAGLPIERPLPDPHPSVDPQGQAHRSALRRAIEDCADRLRSLHHDVFVRFYLEDKSVAEVASRTQNQGRLRQERPFPCTTELAELLEREGLDAMKKNRNQLTDGQLDRFIVDLRELPAEAVGEHLTDDEFIGYVSEELSTEEVTRLDKHLASCAACAGEVERLFEVSQAWQSAQGAACLTALRWRIRSQQALNRLADALSRKQPDFAFQAAHAATAQAWKGETEGGLLHWFIEEDPDSRDLIIRLDSVELALEGAKLRLTAGEWRSDVVLSRVAPDQVGAEARFHPPSASTCRLEHSCLSRWSGKNLAVPGIAEPRCALIRRRLEDSDGSACRLAPDARWLGGTRCGLACLDVRQCPLRVPGGSRAGRHAGPGRGSARRLAGGVRVAATGTAAPRTETGRAAVAVAGCAQNLAQWRIADALLACAQIVALDPMAGDAYTCLGAYLRRIDANYPGDGLASRRPRSHVRRGWHSSGRSSTGDLARAAGCGRRLGCRRAVPPRRLPARGSTPRCCWSWAADRV